MSSDPPKGIYDMLDPLQEFLRRLYQKVDDMRSRGSRRALGEMRNDELISLRTQEISPTTWRNTCRRFSTKPKNSWTTWSKPCWPWNVNSANADDLNEAFRLIHSIKGSAGMMGFDNITVLTHHLENRFERFRSGLARLDEPTMNLVLRCVDFLRQCNDRLRTSQPLGTATELLAEFKRLEEQALASSPNNRRRRSARNRGPLRRPRRGQLRRHFSLERPRCQRCGPMHDRPLSARLAVGRPQSAADRHPTFGTW